MHWLFLKILTKIQYESGDRIARMSSCIEHYFFLQIQGDSERTDVFWTASTGGGVVRLWWGMARLKEETREFQFCSVSIIDSRCLPGVVLEKVRSNNCRWANCTPNCDFRGVQRVLMQNFRVRWGPFPSQRLRQQTKLSLLVPNEPWNSASRPSALP